jgi:GntR family transcriptional regulator, rspAB operon transcriptional repressor
VLHPESTVAALALADGAYAAIKRSLIRLEISPGDTFTESQLAAELGLSKTPIREALARLRISGFVDVTPRTGYRATPVTVKQTRDLLALRKLLDADAAALAAARAGDRSNAAEFDGLLRLASTPVGQDGGESVDRFIETNSAFHRALAHAAGNSYLSSVLDNIIDLVERVFRLGVALNPPGTDVIHDHGALAQAIVRGDVEGARAVVETQAGAAQAFIMDGLLHSPQLLTTNIPFHPAGDMPSRHR